jgi:hypothetical protein
VLKYPLFPLLPHAGHTKSVLALVVDEPSSRLYTSCMC